MALTMNDLLRGDLNDPANHFQGVRDSLPALPSTNPHRPGSPSTLESIAPGDLFQSASDEFDTQMSDPLRLPAADPSIDNPVASLTIDIPTSNFNIDQVISELQAKLKLDPEHLIIASLTSKCAPEARHANVIFAQAAFHQLALAARPSLTSNHVYNEGFKLLDEPTALEHYRDTVGELLKHQRSNLRALLLTNILETQRVAIKGPIYQDLPPRGQKMTAAEIQLQVNNNWAMRIRMSYERLVMVHYYVHKSKKTSQWLEIDKRLAILRGSSIEFQQQHAQLVLDKDHELFSHFRNYVDIPKEEFTVPTLENCAADTRISLAVDTARFPGWAITAWSTGAAGGDIPPPPALLPSFSSSLSRPHKPPTNHTQPEMSKYVSLPDIDTAPDVYETPDLPTIHITERDDDSDSEVLPPGGHAQPAKTHSPNTDIIKDTLDQSSARKKFGAASGLDGRDADFSTSLLRKPPRRASARGYPPPASRSQTFETDEYTILPRGYAVDGRPGEETALERLRRLRFEVAELEEEIEQASHAQDAARPDQQPDAEDDPAGAAKRKPTPAPSPAELLAELHHLRQQLEKLSVSAGPAASALSSASQLRAREAYAKTLLQQLAQRGPSTLPPAASSPPFEPTVLRETTAAQLDGRLSVLEDLLGSHSLLQAASTASGGGEISLPPPLLVTIAKLEHQLSLLTQPRHLDSISRRVKVIVTDLERVHEARRKLTDSRPLSIALASGITVVTHNQQQPGSSALANVPGVIAPAPDRAPPLPPDALHKLDRLYSLLPRLDPLLPLVPHLLSRLRSLAHLHASADSFRTRLDDALNRLRASADRTTHLSQLLTSIQNNADANHALVAQNLALVDQRIDRLLLAVDRLKPS
ncbi:hypothetical protein PtB15_10B303 [Puccinia triticina]|nr:hypothetical protein PtB15_10B303 [Puccinia triticina]